MRILRGARLALVLIAAACSYGQKPESFGPAFVPIGAAVDVDLAEYPQRLELLAVSDSGLFLGQRSRILFARYDAIRRVQAPEYHLDYLTGRRAPASEEARQLRLVCRYPQGIPDAVLATLLRRSGQAAVEELK